MLVYLRRDTAHRWLEVNPVLFRNEPGAETDTHAVKMGDGVTRWADLPYLLEPAPGERPWITEGLVFAVPPRMVSG